MRSAIFASLALALIVLFFVAWGIRICGLHNVLFLLTAQLSLLVVFPIVLGIMLAAAIAGTFYDGEFRSWKFVLPVVALALLSVSGGFFMPGDCSFP